MKKLLSGSFNKFFVGEDLSSEVIGKAAQNLVQIDDRIGG
jgi:hypothetical protein